MHSAKLPGTMLLWLPCVISHTCEILSAIPMLCSGPSTGLAAKSQSLLHHPQGLSPRARRGRPSKSPRAQG